MTTSMHYCVYVSELILTHRSVPLRHLSCPSHRLSTEQLNFIHSVGVKPAVAICRRLLISEGPNEVVAHVNNMLCARVQVAPFSTTQQMKRDVHYHAMR
jgi:hypothetical protein